MKNVIIIGGSGMIGNLILNLCLEHHQIGQVASIVRKKSGIQHPKLVEVVHNDFLNFSDIKDVFSNQHFCFYCLGVYTGQVSKAEFAKITIDYTKSFSETLIKASPEVHFSFLSGQGADRTEKSAIMFAKDKGIAENQLHHLHFKKLYVFRPGYIYPITPRKEPNFTYKLLNIIYPNFLKFVYPNIGVTSVHLANVMFQAMLHGNEQEIFENKAIRTYKLTT